MRAIRLQAQGGADQMRLDDAPQPVPNNGEVLIKVHATAVTPTELLWDLTWSTYAGEPRTLPILSHEFSGEVAELGEGVSDMAVGDEVYGLNDWTVNGALAQYMIATPAQLAKKTKFYRSSTSSRHTNVSFNGLASVSSKGQYQ